MDRPKLDNPIWYSLEELQKEYAIDYGTARFYDPAYCSFGGFVDYHNLELHIDKYAELTNSFFIVGDEPIYSDQICIEEDLVCDQFILDEPVDVNYTEDIVALDDDFHKSNLFDLILEVFPGFFMKRTADLGRYFGIYKNNRLVAVTGERLRMNGYTEVSAVVTHPDYARKGYAQQLVAYTSNVIFQDNCYPYLHTASGNYKAIGVYRKLGFRLRRKISFWKLTKK